MSPSLEITYSFLGWQVEPSANRLIRLGKEFQVKPKTMDVLVCLLESGGRVVSKDEFLREVWSDLAVTDDVLVVAIYELRKVLGDSARRPSYVETVVRRGYRFLPSVDSSRNSTNAEPFGSPVVGPVADPQSGSRSADGSTRKLSPQFLSRAQGGMAVTALFICLMTSPFVFSSWRSHEGAEPQVERSSVRAQVPITEAFLLQARRHLNERNRESSKKAERLYRKLAELRPGDPRAEAGLARVAAQRADLRLGDRLSLYYEARSRAERALELDPDLVDAHLALAVTHLAVDWNFTAGAQSLAQALSLDPDDPDIHQAQAWISSGQGDHAAAIHSASLAAALDPATAPRKSDLAFFLLVSGSYDEAVAEAEAALKLDAESLGARAVLIRASIARGDFEGATRELLSLLESSGANERQMAGWAKLGDQGYWTLAEHLMKVVSPNEPSVARASALANLGRMDEAFIQLERAIERRDWEILWLEELPELKRIRSEKRFEELLERRAFYLAGEGTD